MSREIKFRVYVPLHDKLFSVKECEFNDGVMVKERNEDVFMQFTGLKDKNEKDIYEGDILSDWTETDEGLKQSFYKVFWNKFTGSYHVDNSMNQDESFSVELWKELNDFEYEVTGNIYENPELLKS